MMHNIVLGHIVRRLSAATATMLLCARLCVAAAPANVLTSAPGHVYVTVQLLEGSAVLAYPINANGDQPPSGVLFGRRTLLCIPGVVKFDTSGLEYITDQGACGGIHADSQVLIFAPEARGDTPPMAVIAGPATGFREVWGLAFDSADDAYVVDQTGGPGFHGAIDLFAPGAHGNVAPAEQITGSATQLANPTTIALDSAGNMFVANMYASYILEFAAGKFGNVTPIAVFPVPQNGENLQILGSTLYATSSVHHTLNPGVTMYALPSFSPIGQLAAMRFWEPFAVDGDPAGNVYVANFTRRHNVAILRYPPGASQPDHVIRGVETLMKHMLPRGMNVGF